jgi:hypothetical protein
MDATKPYKFIGFGAMDATKPYEFIGFGVMARGGPFFTGPVHRARVLDIPGSRAHSGLGYTGVLDSSIYPPLGTDIFDPRPKLAKTGPNPAINRPKPAQNRSKTGPTGQKPAKNQNLAIPASCLTLAQAGLLP